MIFALLVGLIVVLVSVTSLAPQTFTPFDLGTIQPQGWLKDQLVVQSKGMSRNVDEIWPDVANSGWLGGWAEGWERFPYYLDGFVGLAVQSNDPVLLTKLHKHVDYILTHQNSNGWLGPVQGRGNWGKGYNPKYDPWPQWVILKALTQYAEAFPTDTRVVPAIKKSLKKLSERLSYGFDDYKWAKYRWQDLTVVIHWMYDRQPEQWLLDMSQRAAKIGYDWVSHYSNFTYTTKQTMDTCPLACHGVNSAQGVKAGALLWRERSKESFSDTRDFNNPKDAIEALDKYHGMPSGVFTSDELYAGLDPTQGTELCTVVEYMYSIEVAAAITGDSFGSFFGDRLERIAYKALPSTFDPDMKNHQYVQQVNQVTVRATKSTNFTNVGGHGNLYGTAPNYGCCTANYHQGWPKLVKHLWMRTKTGVAAVVYAPSKFSFMHNNVIFTLEMITEYPFGNGTVQINVQADKPNTKLDLLLRIPQWAKGTKIVQGSNSTTPIEGKYFVVVGTYGVNVTSITLLFPMKPRVEPQYKGAVSVHRGPLLFGLYYSNYIQAIKNCEEGQCDDPYDYQFLPTTDARWNYALRINMSDIESSIAFVEKKIHYQPFDSVNPAVIGTVRGRTIYHWLTNPTYYISTELPTSPVASDLGPETEVQLVPFGATELRIAMFPILQLV